jgi:hypothetical protein
LELDHQTLVAGGQLGAALAQRVDRRIGKRLAGRPSGAQTLVVTRLRLKPVGGGPRQSGIKLCQILGDNRSAAGAGFGRNVYNALARSKRNQSPFRPLESFAKLAKPVLKKAPRVRRGFVTALK